jgi:tetratricopeptide (TPR) repeat protein
MRAAVVLLRLSVSAETAHDQIAKIYAWAARFAATRFPKFVLLDSSGPTCSPSKLNSKDPRNAVGFWTTDETAIAHRKVEHTFQEEVLRLVDRGRYAEAIARLDRLMADARPPRDQLQLLMALKGQLYFSLNETQMSVKLLDQAILLDPESESGHRARNAKYEVARLLQRRAPRGPSEPLARPASKNAGTFPRGLRLRLSAPTILAMRSAVLSQETLTTGAGISAAQQFGGE